MPWLVDGDNLLGTWPGRRRSDAERRGLAFELSRFAGRRGQRLTVIFDGSAPPGAAPGPGSRYSGAGVRADDVILGLLRETQDRAGWIVVTSDRSLSDQCRWLGARVERCDRFRKRLSSDTAPEKPEREDDPQYWLERFGGDGAD